MAFDIGNDHYYYDDFADDEIITRVAQNSYIPMADTLLDMIQQSNREFKFAISISGTAIEQLQMYVPEYIDKLRQLSETGIGKIIVIIMVVANIEKSITFQTIWLMYLEIEAN